ncbi:hypothetical protein [Lysobacter gummosus]|uniref:hypothetical protein n=1 Tax=Lysobacter gummosus TaxID=262324 RepID=UPI003634A7EA
MNRAAPCRISFIRASVASGIGAAVVQARGGMPGAKVLKDHLITSPDDAARQAEGRSWQFPISLIRSWPRAS